MAQKGGGAVGVMGRVLLVTGALAVVVGGSAWWWVSSWLEEQRTRERKKQEDEDAVQAAATVSESCPKDRPILVEVKNRSSRVLKSFGFRI